MNLKRLFCAALLTVVFGCLPLAADTVVLLGSDYLQTLPGTFFIVPGIGPVPLTGRPIGPGLTDTIVQRQRDALIPTGGSDTIPVEIMALSLVSAGPIDIGGSFFDVFVTLDPAQHSTGTMTISGDTGGGTFDSFFDVFFELDITPVGGGLPILAQTGNIQLLSNGSSWFPTPQVNSQLVAGVCGDPLANKHDGCPQGVDFFPVLIEEVHPGGLGMHVVKPADTPEPASLLLMGTGVVAVLRRVRRRK